MPPQLIRVCTAVAAANFILSTMFAGVAIATLTEAPRAVANSFVHMLIFAYFQRRISAIDKK